MIVIVVSLVSESLKGSLTAYLMEVSSGVFVGTVDAKTRDSLWEHIRGNLGRSGNAIMIYKASTTQGYAIKMEGQRSRGIKDLDGVDLIFLTSDKPDGVLNKSGWSKHSKWKKRKSLGPP